jgi:hypothetical protein
MTSDVFSGFSLIEWLIFGFIGANLALVGVCLIHNGVKRLAPPPAKD